MSSAHLGHVQRLLIAAIALNFGLPLVSDNKKHFARDPASTCAVIERTKPV